MRKQKDEFTEGIIDSLARLILSDMHKEKDAEDESASECERREHEHTHSASQSHTEF